MKPLVLRAAAVLAAAAVILLGAAGVYGYGADYNLHRGFSSVVALPRAGTGRLLDVHFRSTALHRRADYMVYLPPHYSAARRYPVLYLLHGMPGQPHVFVTIANLDVRLDNLISQGRARSMILVFPDGRIGGNVFSDSEWANTPSGQFESYVLEVVHNVDAHFATLHGRQDRVIGGFSAGAYGAMNIALHHLGTFGAVQSWSGYFTQTHSGVFAHADPATMAFNSPYVDLRHVAPEIRRVGLRVFMYVGRDDSSSPQQRPMADRLRAAGATVGTALYAGGHDWSVWYPRLNAMLVLASRDTAQPVPVAPRSRPARIRRWARAAALAPARIALPAPPAARSGGAPPAHRHRPGSLALFAALGLALVSGALINIGFVLQQRGLHTPRVRAGGLPAAMRTPSWLCGQLVGWVGFAGQVLAVALAPLTLVQAFAAGSLALSIPAVSWAFGLSVGRAQARAVAVVAACLFLLPLGIGHHHPHLAPGALIGLCLLGAALALGCARLRRGPSAAMAAGLCYGIADAAIKADAAGLRVHGPGALLSGWTVLVALGTFAGFVSFQSALAGGEAVTAISVMNALTAITALCLGVLAFGESLGSSAPAVIAHVAAIGLVLACVVPLARVQQAIAGPVDPPAPRAPRAPLALHRIAARAAGGVLAAVVAVAGALVAVGLLYALRSHGWLGLGPRVGDALPLLQLAGFAGQPLVRVALAALAAGAAIGILLRGLEVRMRIALVALAAATALLAASDASYALARNLRLDGVLTGHSPGAGPWVQALLLALGAAAPELAARLRRVVARIGAPAGVSAAPPALPETLTTVPQPAEALASVAAPADCLLPPSTPPRHHAPLVSAP